MFGIHVFLLIYLECTFTLHAGAEEGLSPNCPVHNHYRQPEVCESLTDPICPLRPGFPTLHIEDFGAVNDGVTDSTSAFKSAIDTIRQAGGGLLVVPCGVFVSMPLRLVSNMTLFLKRGSTLRATDASSRWEIVEPLESYGHGREGFQRGRRVAFLSGEGLQDIRIIGEWGTIDGNGWSWWESKWGAGRNSFDGFSLPHLLEFRHSKGLVVSNLRLVNSPFWTIHPFACVGVVVRDVEIEAPEEVVNTDGVNPDSCEDVLIENVVYKGGDDAVSMKSGWDCFGDERGFNRPTRNVVIRNMTIRNTGIAAAIAVGSEMSGGIENVLVEDVRVANAGPSGGAFVIKSGASRGGFVRNITVRRLQVGNVAGPGFVIVHPNSFPSNPACSSLPAALPEISEITLEDVQQIEGTSVGEPPVFLGTPEERTSIKGLRLQNVRLVSMKQPEPAPWRSFPACAGAEVTLMNVSFAGRQEPGQWFQAGWDGYCMIVVADEAHLQ